MAKEFKPCENCDPARKNLCAKFGTCLGKDKAKKGDKKPVRKGTYG
jgi:hypothetical protein